MRHALLAAVLAAAVGCGSSAATPEDAGLPIDGGGGEDGSVGYDFTALHDYLFGGTWNTEGALVVLRGETVYEEYAAGYTATMRHQTYSVTKSVASALIGIAVDEGLLDLDASVCTYVTPPVAADPTLCDTTITHLLHMSSGLSWNESFEDTEASNALQMLYGDVTDMSAYTASLPRVAAAGEQWLYSTGGPTLLARALRTALAGQDMRAWSYGRLFDPAGMTSVVFEADRAGTLDFSSACVMTPRDMARFGRLYLGDGVLDGTRILPAGWVAWSLTPAPSRTTPELRDPALGPGNSGGSYGALWWLNATGPDAPLETWAYPEVPVDAYSAEGFWGQDIFVLPSQEVIVVRVGNDRESTFDSGRMVGLALAALAGGDQ